MPIIDGGTGLSGKMGKSFTSIKRQVTETRRRSKKRGGGEVGRIKRESLYAHMRAGGKPEPETEAVQSKSSESAWIVEDMEAIEPDSQTEYVHSHD